VRRTGGAHHVFFNHDGPEIVGACVQHNCAVCLPTVSQEACMFFTFGSIMRLKAIMRMYLPAW
jgi:hypothetical protein